MIYVHAMQKVIQNQHKKCNLYIVIDGTAQQENQHNIFRNTLNN